jgi:phosphoribosylglycinamide formyltransferase-1
MIRLALFASGSGSNVENIAHYFSENTNIKIVSVFTPNAHAYVLERAKRLNIPSVVFTSADFYETDRVLTQLKASETDWIILAGFLWLVPEKLLNAFPGRIINIHPALLPKHGGKGMYGMRVHQAVIGSGDKESGITIHFVNAAYDQGDIIFQARCPVSPGETPESLAAKVHQLEYAYYPKIIEKLVSD